MVIHTHNENDRKCGLCIYGSALVHKICRDNKVGCKPGADSPIKNCIVFGAPLPGSLSVDRNIVKQDEKKAVRKP